MQLLLLETLQRQPMPVENGDEDQMRKCMQHAVPVMLLRAAASKVLDLQAPAPTLWSGEARMVTKWKTVVLLPVPGGPWMALRPPRRPSTADCWLALIGMRPSAAGARRCHTRSREGSEVNEMACCEDLGGLNFGVAGREEEAGKAVHWWGCCLSSACTLEAVAAGMLA